MIEISYRPDLQLTLMRLFDRVTLAEHLRALRSELVTAQDPPLDFIVLIDARRVLDFDLSLPDLMRLGMRVATIYLHHPRPMVVHVLADQDWHSRFIEAFMGPMRNLQRFATGEDDRLFSGVEDAYETMALVEACFTALETPAVPLDLS